MNLDPNHDGLVTSVEFLTWTYLMYEEFEIDMGIQLKGNDGGGDDSSISTIFNPDYSDDGWYTDAAKAYDSELTWMLYGPRL